MSLDRDHQARAGRDRSVGREPVRRRDLFHRQAVGSRDPGQRIAGPEDVDHRPGTGLCALRGTVRPRRSLSGQPPVVGPPCGLSSRISITRRVAGAQTVPRLAAGVGRCRTAFGEAPVTRVRVREVASTIGGQPQERAYGSVGSVRVDPGHGEDMIAACVRCPFHPPSLRRVRPRWTRARAPTDPDFVALRHRHGLRGRVAGSSGMRVGCGLAPHSAAASVVMPRPGAPVSLGSGYVTLSLARAGRILVAGSARLPSQPGRTVGS